MRSLLWHICLLCVFTSITSLQIQPCLPQIYANLSISTFVSTIFSSPINSIWLRINEYFKLLGLYQNMFLVFNSGWFVKFKGCKIEKLSPSDMSRLGLNAGTEGHKRAILSVPLDFPKAKLKRRKWPVFCFVIRFARWLFILRVSFVI